MPLQPRRPPGHAKRKALAYSADIVSLRAQGHTLVAIREALEDAGIAVSISTVRREVLKGTPPTARSAPSATSTAQPDGLATRGQARTRAGTPDSVPSAGPLPGKTIAEEFMRGSPTNTLFLKESPP